MVRFLPVLLLVGACGDFESKSIVLDLRVIGIVAEPAEVVVDFDLENPTQIPELPPVTVSALIGDPGEDRPLAYRWRVCAETDSRRCDEPQTIVIPLGEGVIEDPDRSGQVATGTVVVNPLLLEEAIDFDNLAGFGGIGVQVELRVVPVGGGEEQAIYAAKRVVYAPRIPATRVANQNPAMLGLVIGEDEPFDGSRCDDPDATPREVAPGEEVRLEPVEVAGIRETYVLPTLDGGERTFVENMRYAWFATAGDWSPSGTGGPTDAFGNVPVLFTRWTAPEGAALEALRERTGGLVDVWVVQRDERGGQSYLRRCFRVP